MNLMNLRYDADLLTDAGSNLNYWFKVEDQGRIQILIPNYLWFLQYTSMTECFDAQIPFGKKIICKDFLRTIGEFKFDRKARLNLKHLRYGTFIIDLNAILGIFVKIKFDE